MDEQHTMTDSEKAVVRMKEWLFRKFNDNSPQNAATKAFIEDITMVLALAEAHLIVTKQCLTGDDNG